MKILIFLMLTGFTFCAQAQDSTSISFESPDDEYLNLSNELNGISIVKVSCKDTTLWGKKIFLSCDEYLDGNLIDEDDFGLNRVMEHPVVVEGDTMIHKTDMSERMRFREQQKSYDLIFAGKLNGDTLKMIHKLPGLSFMCNYSGDKDFFMRRADFSRGEMRIALNQKQPVLVYTAPFRGEGYNYLCILGSEPFEKWYEKFNVNHFYVFNLKISDD